MVARITPGRLLLTLVGAALPPGAFVADYNETHLFNPRWPPHAKFHNGQTMSMGVCLGLACLYYTWRDSTIDSAVTATIFGSVYYVTGLAAWFYPETLAVDPEFGEGFPQLKIFATALVLAWAGCALEVRRVGRERKAVSGKVK
ncbi:uncharacterized protein A1O9_06503 [Exophiala aquamarina CBS 119918]|uniref:Acetyltransferase n=1 Tax=Exophiala aquamarina CBS 119918 TaxID=1182545 RepID=A0A072PFN3_9EURO|nr:uncharacterized protein A1O9_06503 [Exophiala aquamarina CBS 119918]KEF58577.1 hypothetical protein A1O9_06503 [Exophiala aquamarina CBS 119918]